MKFSSIHQRFLVTLFAVLQLVLPGFAGVSMCALGRPSGNCCCAPEAASPIKSCCSEEQSEQTPEPQISLAMLETDCGCTQAPESSPVQFPELPGSEGLDQLMPAPLEVLAELQPAAPLRPVLECKDVWPPGGERPMRVLHQVFRL